MSSDPETARTPSHARTSAERWQRRAAARRMPICGRRSAIWMKRRCRSYWRYPRKVRLLGTLTDGDIRRGLLRGLDMSSSIETIIYRDPLVVPPQLSRETVLQLMRVNKIHQLPVVDAERRVVGLHLWDELMAPRRRPNLMVIMAGGRGQPFASADRELPETAAAGRRQADARAHHRAGQSGGIRAFRAGGALPRTHDRGPLRQRQSLADRDRLFARGLAPRHRGCAGAA